MLWNTSLWDEMEHLRREMNSLFSNHGYSNNSTYPLLNVYNDDEKVVVSAELSGVKSSDITTTFSDGILRISGKRKSPEHVESMEIVRKERTEGEFEKTIKIPTKVKSDAINASFKDGILTITLPKAEDVKPKAITIKAD